MITTALALQFTRDTQISICRTNNTSLHHLLTLLRALNPSKSLMLPLHLKWTTRLNCETMDCHREHLNSGLNPVIHHRYSHSSQEISCHHEKSSQKVEKQMFLNEVKLARAGEIVPENPCFLRVTVITFPCPSQETDAQLLLHGLFPSQDWASVIGYPKPPATARSAVTCGSQGPGSNVHQFRKTRYGNRYNPGQLVVSELQIEEIYAFGKVLEIRERIEEVRNDAGDTGVARVERSQICAFGQITRNLPWAELAIKSPSRLDILAKDGKVPEREFFWTESVRRDASCVISEGSSPEMDSESRLMETTLPVDLSQLTLVHVHRSLEADQPEGAGERAAKSLDMTAASSQNETERRPSKRSKRRKDGAFWEDIAGGV
nr:hypothetical protein Iba_chr12eCG4280 [Ipomoea batatas]